VSRSRGLSGDRRHCYSVPELLETANMVAFNAVDAEFNIGLAGFSMW